jgi:GxxExxY protein
MSQRKDAKTQRLDREALNDLSRLIITKGIEVHSKLGPGLLESVYRTCLAYELRKAGLHVTAEQLVPVFYDGELQLDNGYRLDLLVAHEIIVEVKAVEKLLPVHLAQLLSYLRLADKRLGLLLNFNSTRLVHGLRRVVNNF